MTTVWLVLGAVVGTFLYGFARDVWRSRTRLDITIRVNEDGSCRIVADHALTTADMMALQRAVEAVPSLELDDSILVRKWKFGQPLPPCRDGKDHGTHEA